MIKIHYYICIFLPEKYIIASTDVIDIVGDPLMGSGSTGYAALTLGRLFVGFDVVGEYVTQANERLHAIVGGTEDGERKTT